MIKNETQLKICKYCGKEFVSKRKNVSSCDECRSMVHTKICKYCEKEFTTKCRKTLLCDECRNIGLTKQCVFCGKEFVTRRTNVLACDKCREKIRNIAEDIDKSYGGIYNRVARGKVNL